ncbi:MULTISPECIES: GNAT family N-acetyltransferase [Synergistaceae]|uniref:GNAT family N-acetyltransferase n=1 Tax=Synergistaceae TaxID=649777 RepID=UPI003AD956D2|nr:bifunctional UDP-2,4-diacetamido-2,4,6-trideoxy-beta-L-altropyranose hydrolase/GNAT family N-acetyltransferase [Synergistaceae bacterium DZ-S4]
MTVIILTEGGKYIGLGHLSRCISLYDEIYTRGINVKLIVFGNIEKYEFLKSREFIKENWLKKEYLNNNITNEDFVIVDSYKAEKELYDIIASKSKKALYIDDYGRLVYPKGIILNPALDSSGVFYSTSLDNDLLIGSRYVILRSSFIGQKRNILRENKLRVLVVMGGTDVRNLTSLIIDEICIENKDVVFNIIIAGSKPESKNLINVFYHVNLSEDKICQLMLNSDLAVSAAGQTIYELIATQTPFIAVQVVDNQKNNISAIRNYIDPRVALEIDAENFVADLKRLFIDMKTINLREILVNKMNNLIDGFGRKRVVDALLYNSHRIDNLILRMVKNTDMKGIFELSNQDDVRRYSINKNKIDWNNHVSWFTKVLKDPNVVFYVVTDKEKSFLGQVRFYIENLSATVSISLSEELRNKGLSKAILHKGIVKFLNENEQIEEIIAFVFENNIASKKLFEGLNFKEVCTKDNMLKFTLKRGAF